MRALPQAHPITVRPGVFSIWRRTRELYSKYLAGLTLGAALNFSQVSLGYGSIALASLVLFPMTKTNPDSVPLYMTIVFIFAFFGGLTSVFMVDAVGRKVTGLLSHGSYFICHRVIMM